MNRTHSFLISYSKWPARRRFPALLGPSIDQREKPSVASELPNKTAPQSLFLRIALDVLWAIGHFSQLIDGTARDDEDTLDSSDCLNEVPSAEPPTKGAPD